MAQTPVAQMSVAKTSVNRNGASYVTYVFACVDLRVRHPAEVRRHADITGGERESEHATGLRAAGFSRRRRDRQESSRRGD